MLAGNRGKVMKKCKKMIVLIMVFALCFGFSACGGGGSDNNDTVENEDDRGSGGSEAISMIRRIQYNIWRLWNLIMTIRQSSWDTVLLKRCVYRNMK